MIREIYGVKVVIPDSVYDEVGTIIDDILDTLEYAVHSAMECEYVIGSSVYNLVRDAYRLGASLERCVVDGRCDEFERDQTVENIAIAAGDVITNALRILDRCAI